MKLYEIYDRDTGLGFSKFDNMKGWVPVWKDKPKQYKAYPAVQENFVYPPEQMSYCQCPNLPA